MVVSVLPPFPQVTDRDGAPLQSGYIYIGTANTNPITNQIAVFFDAAMTIPATQPLRTSGGFIINGSGTPANVYTATDFSITVQDRNATTLYTAPSYGFRVFSDAITFNTLIVGSSIVPDAAGGATSGSNALPWATTTTRDLQAKTGTFYSTTQPAATADFAARGQLDCVLCIAEQTSTGATAGWINGKNVNTAGSSRTAPGTYEVAFTVPLPAQYFPVGTIIDGGAGCEIEFHGRTANRILVSTSVGGVATNEKFSLIIFGNPGVADPIS